MTLEQPPTPTQPLTYDGSSTDPADSYCREFAAVERATIVKTRGGHVMAVRLDATPVGLFFTALPPSGKAERVFYPWSNIAEIRLVKVAPPFADADGF